MQEREIFNTLAKIPVEHREAVLEAMCGQNPELLRQVESLLKDHDQSSGFLANKPGWDIDVTQDAPQAIRPGTLIAGRYKLLEEIGEGGMGSVWLAEQMHPVKRKVAIKLIKPGMDSRQVLARFDAERQALAMMDHPHIAKVFDGGVNEQGRPYFVMEYVKGVPLTDYCDNARVSLRDRLKLFVQICQAVQHAHQKGIIHRDLKPSNILVCLYDGEPVPKVIDFGLAKAMHHSLTDMTLHTAHGLMVGTPLYMSPEQAELNNLDVDTRTDIYSLGVILYELLTGSTPLEKQQLKLAALNEVLRLIKEVEPPKPSMRLSGSASLPSIAALRGLEPSQLSRSVKGELDWIVMKALDKERGRRYETANGLARDLERFLNDETVEASPPSTSYRVRKFIRKHRVALSTFVAFVVLLLSGTGISVWQAVRATFAERDAQTKKQDADQATEKATTAREAMKDAFNGAVDDYLGDQVFGTTGELTPLGVNERNFLLRLRSYYDELADSAPEGPEKADAWMRTGTIRARLGDRPAMLQALHQAKSLWLALVEQGGEHATDYRRELARIHDKCGRLIALGVDPNDQGYRAAIFASIDEYRQAADNWRELAQESPRELSFLLAQASSLRNQGNGILDPILTYQAQAEVEQKIIQAKPQQYETSLPVHREEVAVLKSAVSIAPNDSEVRFRYVRALANLATAVGMTRRSDPEFIDLLVERKIAEVRFRQEFPNVQISYPYEFSFLRNDGISPPLFYEGQFDPVNYRREVVEVFRRTADALPQYRFLRIELLNCYNYLASETLRISREKTIPPSVREIIAEAREVSANCRNLFPNQPEDPEGAFLGSWGQMLNVPHHLPVESAAVLREAIQVANEHAPERISPEYQRFLARLHAARGQVLTELNDPDAVSEIEVAKELNKAAEAVTPDPPPKQ